jgi:endogenous inhibitor of DNA gyrase (YacG/DUF329 family)
LFVAKYKTESPWEFDLRCPACGKRVGTESWAHKDPPPEIDAYEWLPEKRIVFAGDSDLPTTKENCNRKTQR